MINFLLVLLLTIVALPLRAEVTVAVDRNQVALGDTLQLVVTATGGEDLDDVDLAAIGRDFEILQRSTNSSTRWVNGERSHTRQIIMDVMPRREGTLEIPAMNIDGEMTQRVLVAVGPAPAANTSGQNVVFQAELDREQVYVQGQVILTLRLLQAINLESRSISELELDGAFVKPLEQKSFQRVIEGRPWLVHEVRYAIFPEQSGELVIPAQTFSARETVQRRSMFDRGARGRQMRRSTEALVIDVLPRPSEFPSSTWLPASSLRIEENWSTPPEQLKAGESATRTIRIQGEGLQGAQLPPILFPATEGLKYYPDQPVINDSEVSSGLMGTRQDSAALVPVRAGEWEIPEIRVPWWDTETEELRHAVIPARRITVAAAAPAVGEPTVVAPTGGVPVASGAVTPGTVASADSTPWKVIAVVNGIGWLLTLAWLVRSSKSANRGKPGPGKDDADASERQLFKALQNACTSGETHKARQALINWAGALFPGRQLTSLQQVDSLFDDTSLSAEIAALDAALYGGSGEQWNGRSLLAAVEPLREQYRKNRGRKEESLSLYPRIA